MSSRAGRHHLHGLPPALRAADYDQRCFWSAISSSTTSTALRRPGRSRDGGGVALVGGEAGIGKTSLVRAFANRRPDGRVLTGACEPLTTPRPLAAAARHRPPDRRPARRPDGQRRRPPRAASPRSSRSWLAEPTVVVIEDVHWADEATLDLLVFLGRRLADTPSMLVLTLREHTPDPPPRLAEVVGHLAGSRTQRARRRLPPLSLDAVTQLAEGHRVAAVAGARRHRRQPVLRHRGPRLRGRTRCPASVRDAVVGRAAGLSAMVRGQPSRRRPWCRTGSSSTCCTPSAEPAAADLEECERADLLEIGSRASRRTATSSPATRSSTASPPYAASSCTPPSCAHLLTLFRAPRVADRPPRRPRRRLGHRADRTPSPPPSRPPGSAPTARPPPRWTGRWPTSTPADTDQAAAVLGRAAYVFQATGRLEDALDASAAGRRRCCREQDHDDLAVQLATAAAGALDPGPRRRGACGRRRGGPARHRHALARRRGAGARAPPARCTMLAREIPRSLETGRRAVALARERGDRPGLVRALNAVGSRELVRRARRGRAAPGRVAATPPDGSTTTSAWRPRWSTSARGRRGTPLRRRPPLAGGGARVLRRARPRPQPRLRHQLAGPDRARAGRLGPGRAAGRAAAPGHRSRSRASARSPSPAKVRVRRGQARRTRRCSTRPGAAARAVGSPATALAGGRRPGRGGVVRRTPAPDRRDRHRHPRPRRPARTIRGRSASSAGGLAAPEAVLDGLELAAPYAAMVAGDWQRRRDPVGSSSAAPGRRRSRSPRPTTPTPSTGPRAEFHRLGARPDAARTAQRMRAARPGCRRPAPVVRRPPTRRTHRP